jgi:hypothetical protein
MCCSSFQEAGAGFGAETGGPDGRSRLDVGRRALPFSRVQRGKLARIVGRLFQESHTCKVLKYVLGWVNYKEAHKATSCAQFPSINGAE